MVMRGLVWWVLLPALLLPVVSFAAGAPFDLSVESNRVEYGKPIDAVLHARFLHPQLDRIDLSPLDKHFVVDAPDSVRSDAGRQSWHIRLYPRRPGKLTIPSLAFQGHASAPVGVDVMPAGSGRDHKPMRVSTTIDNTAVWVGQGVHVAMQVESDDRFASLSADSPRRDGMEIVTVPYTHHAGTIKGASRTRYRMGWVLYPQAAGDFSIQLPPVKYDRNGVVTHRFYPPKIQLHVRALPPFVPPTMPIGKTALTPSLPDRHLFFEHALYFLTLKIKTEGPSDQRPWAVLRQLRSSDAVTIYPPRVEARHADNQTGAGNELVYQIPFRPKAMGWTALPSVRLQYFDPATGKIETRTQSLGEVITINRWLLYTAVFGLLLALYAFSGLVYRWAQTKVKAYRAYRSALYTLKTASTPQAIKCALMEIARGEGWPTNITLQMWRKQWEIAYPRLADLSDGVTRLQVWLYGGDTPMLDDIRVDLIGMCYRRMPLLKISVIQRILVA